MLISIETYGIYDFPGGGGGGGGGSGPHIPPLDPRMPMIDPLAISKFSNPFSWDGSFSK